MNNRVKQIPELLAPAGNLTCALSAFDSGADAVYAGLEKFNARQRTENFSLEDMSKLIAYARKIKRKVYITLNTLIKESEIGDFSSILADIAHLAPDAVIVQDIGAVRIIRDYFPSLKIHASTQMGIHNSAGIAVAKELGIERVILERQVMLHELSAIMKKSELEVEVFVHGALCCSLSGNCIFSSWLGGASGNRGQCKQPCRRRFFSNSGNGFFFSPKDLYSLEILPELKRLGVSSLKIEGRLRKPDYIKSVVTAYRMVLDAPDGSEMDVLGEARSMLAKSLGRKWSEGFSTEESMKDLIQHDTSGASGQLCGRVAGVEHNGFMVALSKRIHIGDRVRVQGANGDEGPSLTITRMNVNGASSTKALKNTECFIYCNKDIAYNGFVYKIGESCEDMTSRINAMPLLRSKIDMSIDITSDGFTIELKNYPTSKLWQHKESIQVAQKRPLECETVRDEFTTTRSEKLSCGMVDISIDGDLFIPSSVLRKIRREFWEWADANIDHHILTDSAPSDLMRLHDDYKAMKGVSRSGELETVFVKPHGHRPAKKGYLARSIFDYNKETDEVVLPLFCSEERIGNLAQAVKRAYCDGIRRFRVTSLYAIELLNGFEDIVIVGSYPLPVCNSMAAAEFSRLGFVKIQAWLELEKCELEHLINKSSLPVELYRYGRMPLLATRAEIPFEGDLKDARSARFRVIKDSRAGLNYIFSKEVLSIPRLPRSVDFYDLTNAYWNEKETSSFNFDHALL